MIWAETSLGHQRLILWKECYGSTLKLEWFKLSGYSSCSALTFLQWIFTSFSWAVKRQSSTEHWTEDENHWTSGWILTRSSGVDCGDYLHVLWDVFIISVLRFEASVTRVTEMTELGLFLLLLLEETREHSFIWLEINSNTGRKSFSSLPFYPTGAALNPARHHDEEEDDDDDDDLMDMTWGQTSINTRPN